VIVESALIGALVPQVTKEESFEGEHGCHASNCDKNDRWIGLPFQDQKCAKRHCIQHQSCHEDARKRSEEDRKDEIEEVSLHQGDRLLVIAKYFATRAHLSPEDLLQEALTRVLCGDRERPPDVDIVAFLGGVMKSIASSEVRKRARREDAGYAETPADLGLFADTVSDGRAGIEDTICRKEHDAEFHAWLCEQFEDDETMLVLLGMFEGLSGEELCSQTGVTKGQLATIRRRIRRKINEFEGRRGS